MDRGMWFEFMVQIKRGDEKLDYRMAHSSFRDLGTGGLFSFPNRHNIRLQLDHERQRFEDNVVRKMWKRFGSAFGCTYGPRYFRMSGDYTWIADEGEALISLLFPETAGEILASTLADNERRKGVE